MHMQYRTKLADGTEGNGTGAAAAAGSVVKDPIIANVGALARLCREIAAAGINLQAIGGRGIETGGVLLLGVAEGDERKLEDVLTKQGLPWEVYRPEIADLQDRPGQVAEFAAKIAASGRLIDTIVVGAPHRQPPPGGGPGHPDGDHDHDHGDPGAGDDPSHSHVAGTIPIQATTIQVRGGN